MVIDTKVNIQFNSKGAEELYQNLSIILSTPKGCVVLDRDFGIDFSFQDRPLPIARTLFIAQVMEAISKYIPKVTVKEVLFETDEVNGVLKPKVVIDFVDTE